MAGSIINMHGRIVGPGEAGVFIADFTHPDQIEGLTLNPDDQYFTKSYPNPDARTRITNLHLPEPFAPSGALVIAHVDVERYESGTQYNFDRRPGQPYYLPMIEIVGANAVKWGIVPDRF